MTNPHAFSLRTFWTPLRQDLAITQRPWVAAGVIMLACGLAHVRAQAQNFEDLNWQPGQSSVTLTQSTPHHNVRQLLRQAKYAQALLLVNKALSANPRDPQMRFWLGFIYERLGQPELAVPIYQNLTQEYPELAEPHNNLGVIYAAQGDYSRAKESLDAALHANPTYSDALENMGDLLLNMAYQSYQQARLAAPKDSRLPQKIERLQPLLEPTLRKP